MSVQDELETKRIARYRAQGDVVVAIERAWAIAEGQTKELLYESLGQAVGQFKKMKSEFRKRVPCILCKELSVTPFMNCFQVLCAKCNDKCDNTVANWKKEEGA